jgi:hypothetical protein
MSVLTFAVVWLAVFNYGWVPKPSEVVPLALLCALAIGLDIARAMRDIAKAIRS